MKAIVCTRYGNPDVLQLREVEKPVPGANEILIRIRATAVNSGDWRLRKADPFAVRLFFGPFKPKLPILGITLSGEVEAIGSTVTRFKVGDEVYASSAFETKMGAYAQYKCLPETAVLALKPAGLSHTEAAVIPFGGTTALHFLRKAGCKPGQRVLIYGASGSVGNAAVQLTKHFGAHVTAVCSTGNKAWVKALGADEVIDYTQEDFAQNGQTYDILFEAVNKIPVSKAAQSVAPKGVLALPAAGFSEMFQGKWVSVSSSKTVLMGMVQEKAEDLVFLKELVEVGALKPVIDRTYTLEQMAEAHAYAEKGHKKGNVAIEVR